MFTGHLPCSEHGLLKYSCLQFILKNIFTQPIYRETYVQLFIHFCLKLPVVFLFFIIFILLPQKRLENAILSFWNINPMTGLFTRTYRNPSFNYPSRMPSASSPSSSSLPPLSTPGPLQYAQNNHQNSPADSVPPWRKCRTALRHRN